ncbi:SGNH/GDSL hydrolase family protein [Streptomyces sp. NE06-03E]|uniref:SGNH/GDSL hydrolase family protein n=1 Tax=Streptomyces silvae TaxID=2803812 RepID=A0ABU7ZZV7_9ACTN|nr:MULTISPECIES: SGNH/GDSL hydrolase family protein [unclassified Streptomyces]WSS61665.1 SGNH/GDSL hydrolase family protein [Streptomyces sp. NBC_01177]WSS75727.1 SGNH/GDSL hydrolase family protein [Streptomyces sp. NBC_01174]MDX3059061.1 SGNH/GDSL hydrolase family protein [Streptomyces sp. NE06-03E]MDX3324006.1 SGNH/GDSL hydrolase family protein [Streptomyces sp. ME02-6979-3A]MDX3430360.1 SGNH/GDSL hydrolase family protein [Streptomyces sp. ME01-18a]
MSERSPRRRARGAAATLTAVALAGAAALTGCTSDGGTTSRSTAGAGSPSASPTPAWDASPASIAAVGDSITRGFDACSVLADCPEVSWATGTDGGVRSLAVRLLGASKAASHSWNHAVSGARMAQLPEQMALAAKDRPELVTVMIGANDACRDSVALMTPVADFRASFEASMRQLRASAPKAQVYVSSVPDLKRLWSTGRENPLGKQIWKLGICRSMLGDADDMGSAAVARRDAVLERVVAYNGVLRDVCARDERCRYDGGAVFDYRFTGEQLSEWDWFHPGRNGQARLAEIAYRAVTAAGPPA